MAESHVLSGLVAKRAELAGEVEHHRGELHRLAEALSHVDATIRLFDPALCSNCTCPTAGARGRICVPH